MNKIIIVGGGAAGLMAAVAASSYGARVELYEKNNRIGKKLLITGKGRCNITNVSERDQFLAHIPGNPSFMFSAYSKFDYKDTIQFFSQYGLLTKTERGGRVFPQSDKAADVVQTFEQALARLNVRIYYNQPVQSLLIDNGNILGVELKSGERKTADAVILATGGLSYPKTGSTGDGYQMAKAAGHQVTKLKPSLVGLKAKEKWILALAGLSLKNVAVKLSAGGKVFYEDFGEMLFTHVGVSGPVIISASSHLIRQQADVFQLVIDLKPKLDGKKLDNRILRDFESAMNKNIANVLQDLLPQRMIPVFLQLADIPLDKKVHAITKTERLKLVQLIKNLPVTVTGTEDFSHAIITAGGIDLKEVAPATMASKIVAGLFFAGELLDLDGYTGGYNLQIAFSTGWLAGQSASEYCMADRGNNKHA